LEVNGGEAAHNFLLCARATYDPRVLKRPPTPKGPGLAKSGRPPLVERRDATVFRSTDYRWGELLATADVMSEGAIRIEREGPAYYGTTSLLLPFASRGGLVPDALAAEVVRLASKDVHARVRAVRVACREARVRSVHPIGRIRAELIVRADERGIRIDVDIEARVVATSGRATRKRAR
jgi:hypothetical protein